jgi:hypothetical protein
MRKLVSLSLFLIAATAHADSANLRVVVDPFPTLLHAGETLGVNATVFNAGPDIAHHVVVTMRSDPFTVLQAPLPEPTPPCPNAGCSVGDLKPGDSAKVAQFVRVLPKSDVMVEITVTVYSDTEDPDPSDDTFTKKIIVATSPKLHPSLEVPSFTDPGLPFTVTLVISNDGSATAHDVVATAELPDGVEVVALPPTCSASPGKVDCLIQTLENRLDANGRRIAARLPLTLRAPPRYEGGELRFRAVARESRSLFREIAQTTATTTLYRAIIVTSTADKGAGSLREAINTANATCAPPARCAIQFNISEPSDRPWKTIGLRSALPAIRGVNLRIDGATQAAFSGAGNPDGPSIEISGGFNIGAAGLDIDGLGIQEIGNLAINGFRGDGIALSFDRIKAFGPSSSIHHNFIGTDPTGSLAVPNHRGIGLSEIAPRDWPATTIANNVISGNSRSGLLANGGGVLVSGNRIGVKAHDDMPLPNGGSGIFFNRSGDRIEVSGNVIAFNREMGIAIHPEARYVKVQENRIWGNGGLAIDDGLDGPSPTVSTDDGPLANPSVTSATYDAATTKTTIRGTAAPFSLVTLYASEALSLSGAAEAERFIGEVRALPSGEFTLTVNGDLHGQWIAGTTTRTFLGPQPGLFSLGRTSELGTALQAQ